MMDRSQIDMFIDGLARYFHHLEYPEREALGKAKCANFVSSNETLEIGVPYLLEHSKMIGLDYTGVIHMSGSQSGTIFVSAKSSLLKRILLSHGETELNAKFKRDLIGEVANTLAGNARRQLGSSVHISTPTVVEGPLNMRNYKLASRCFALPFRWRSNKAELIVSLGRH